MKQQRTPTYDIMTPGQAESRWQAVFKDRYVGNDAPVETLGDMLVLSMKSQFRVIGSSGVLLLGPASTGKTTLARLSAKYTELPYIESEGNIQSGDDLFKALQTLFSELEGPNGRVFGLVEEKPRHYRVPPCIVFIDEAHKQPAMGEWLLKPTEPNDRTMILRDGRVVDTGYIFFMLGTTNPEKLAGALRTRLDVLTLLPYSTAQVAEIVRRAEKLPPGECMTLAKMSRSIPRVALKYAEKAKRTAERSGVTVPEGVAVVASREGLDDNFLTTQHRAAMKLLKSAVRLAKPRLAIGLGVPVDWLEEEILPGLWQATDDFPAMVRMGARGIELTDEGLALASKL